MLNDLKVKDASIPSRIIYEGLGIAKATIAYWVKAGLIKPAIRKGVGNVPSLWSFSDLIEIKTVSALREAGLPFGRAEKFVEVIHRDKLHFHIKWIATDGKAAWASLTEKKTDFAIPEDMVYLDWQGIIDACAELVRSEVLGEKEES